MAQIYSSIPPASPLPGVYYIAVQPPVAVPLGAADVVAVVGPAIRGPLGTAAWWQDLNDLRQAFGGASLNPKTGRLVDGYTTAKAVTLQGVRDKIFVRAADSTCGSAKVTIMSGTNPVCTLQAASPGSWANGLTYTIAQNVAANTWSLTIVNPATGETDSIPNIPVADNAALLKAINAAATLVTASQPTLDNTTAPTVTSSTSSGTLPLGSYSVITTYTNAAGETQGSPESAAATLSAAGQLTVTPTTVPSAATGFKVYAGAQGQEVYAGTGAISGGTATPLVVSAPPASTLQPPTTNTATTGAGYTAALPTAGSFAFPSTFAAGQRPGADGANPSAAQCLGIGGAQPTGANILAGYDPAPNLVVLAEAAGWDQSSWAAQAALAQANGWQAVVSFAPGTTDTQALAALAASPLLALTTPESAGNLAPLGDYLKVAWPGIVTYDDEATKADLVTGAAGWAAGITAVQPANIPAFNKAIQGDCRPEFRPSRAAMTPLATANVNVITGKIPLAGGVGPMTDALLSGQDSYIIRMRSLLADAFLAVSAPFIGLANDATTRLQLRLDVLGVLDGFARVGLLEPNPAGANTAVVPVQTSAAVSATRGTAGAPQGIQPSLAAAQAAQTPTYAVICDLSNNVVPTSDLYCDVWVALSPSIKHILMRVQAGVGVTVPASPALTGTGL